MFYILLFECPGNRQTVPPDIFPSIYAVRYPADEKELHSELRTRGYDAIVLEIGRDRTCLFRLMQWIRQRCPSTPLIAFGDTADVALAVKVMQAGACDFIPAPFAKEKIIHAVSRAVENRSLRNERDYLRRNQDVIYNFQDIIAETPVMKEIIGNLEKFAMSDSLILMTGETGTGKSFLAGTLHFNSLRRHCPFIIINCANISETLLESELFGHEKGAFTGADRQRIGRFEQAKGGTVFLDEIGEMSLSLQAKLLRVLDDKKFERVGGSETIDADVRFIAATNRNLEQCIREGQFREDLYYRLQVLSVRLPPLKERKACILPLARYLLKNISRNLKKDISAFSPKVLERIQSYAWPGNIRELANCIERAVILEESNVIHPKSFLLTQEQNCFASVQVEKKAGDTGDEKARILDALEQSLWIQKDAAALLGMSDRNMNYRISKYGITHHRWRKNKK
ncbi:MAG: sigma-54 dependent transcriptional regulator [Desulfococcaceae bacterium]|jgi:DNA-binding NtrC family response regulator|nr:sigma-54 dependent transcriptional regulator [Desulfococcaceae bacterium]